MSLEMKYFVLKPRSKGDDDQYAHASRQAMQAYADAIDLVNPDLAQELRNWCAAELISITNLMSD